MNRRAALDCCEKCDASFFQYDDAVCNQFSRQLSVLVEKQQSAAYVCEDVVCAAKMKALPMGLMRGGLECPKCRTSFMKKEYTAKSLFEQQTFFDRLLDLRTAVLSIKNKDQRTTIEFRPNYQKVDNLCKAMRAINDSFMAKNSYNIVDLCFVFGPMMSK